MVFIDQVGGGNRRLCRLPGPYRSSQSGHLPLFAVMPKRKLFLGVSHSLCVPHGTMYGSCSTSWKQLYRMRGCIRWHMTGKFYCSIRPRLWGIGIVIISENCKERKRNNLENEPVMQTGGESLITRKERGKLDDMTNRIIISEISDSTATFDRHHI